MPRDNKDVHYTESIGDTDWISKSAAAGVIAPRFSDNSQANLAAKRRLNLGCGGNKLRGWENYDIDVDITKPLPFPESSTQYVFIEHCVEHVEYYAAIEFFKECRRVLASGGVIRVAVPALDRIYRLADRDYHTFVRRWSPEESLRGSMHAILYAHGHRAAWSYSLLEATLYFAGFNNMRECRPGQSDIADLRGVEGHGRIIGDKFNDIETIVCEADVEK